MSANSCQEGIDPALREMNIRSILVPVDFSATSEKALQYAVPIASRFCAQITLLFVSQVQFYANEFAHLKVEESGISEAAMQGLQSIASRCIPPSLLGELLVRSGVAFDEIAKAAAELNADLIIVNTHGFKGLKHVLAGSKAELIIRYAPCPVLVVREHEHEFV
jgi:nucleotide-binding universal stress UspA family protein